MEIRKLIPSALTASQFEQMVRIEETCGLEPYSPEILLECIEDLNTFACLDQDRIAGFITVHLCDRYLGRELYIINLNVARPYRRQGIGQALIRAACASFIHSQPIEMVTLDVAKDNTAAIHLYSKMGFRFSDIPSRNGDTDMVMTVPYECLIKESYETRIYTE